MARLDGHHRKSPIGGAAHGIPLEIETSLGVPAIRPDWVSMISVIACYFAAAEMLSPPACGLGG